MEAGFHPPGLRHILPYVECFCEQCYHNSAHSTPTSLRQEEEPGMPRFMRWLSSKHSSAGRSNHNQPSAVPSSPHDAHGDPQRSPDARPTTRLQQQQAQHQSPLFKLPAEIRNQIYGELFGRDICHIVSWESGLGHYCCCGVKTDTLELDAPCWGHIWCNGPPDIGVKWGPHKSALLQTCKRLNAEASPMLYASKRFIFTAPSVLLDFVAKVPADMLRYVAFIELSAPPPYAMYLSSDLAARQDLVDWERSIDVLRSITGLRSLYIMVPNTKVFDRWKHSKATEQKLLAPLRQMRPLDTFVVSIAWHEGGSSDQPDTETSSYHFELRRFEGHLPSHG